jgi:hypothetical protein
MANSAERYVNFKKLNAQPPKEYIPEISEEIMKSKMGEFARFVDGVLPVSVQKVLASMMPGNKTMQRLMAINDFRQEHGIRVSRNPLG